LQAYQTKRAKKLSVAMNTILIASLIIFVSFAAILELYIFLSKRLDKTVGIAIKGIKVDTEPRNH